MKKLIIISLFLLIALPTLASTTSGTLTGYVLAPESQRISELQEMINELSLLVEKLQLLINNYGNKIG